MQIVTTTGVFPIGTNHFHIIDRLADLGYTALDMSFDYEELSKAEFMSDNYEEWASRLRKYAENRGVRFTHSHGSFDANATGDIVTRNLRCAQILGIRYMVVHPVFRGEDGQIITDPEQFYAVNQPNYKRLAAEASKYGVIILSENLLWGASIPPIYQSELVAKVNSPNFGWCLDTGHLNRCGLDADALLGLKHPPLSLHVHDNSGKHDEHLLPGDGTIDWKTYLDALRNLGYAGKFVLEAHHQSQDAQDCQRNAILTDLLGRAQLMTQYFCRKNI